ncbi:hypothetical protein [Micromonospora sp. NBC_00860]|nr:hypothetical protein OH804_22050 [Micromonospora sp. NBC_00860]
MNGIGLINATGQPAIAGSFHTLVVQPTSFCNLDCTYCYLPDRRSLWDNKGKFDSRPGWDNWNKKK